MNVARNAARKYELALEHDKGITHVDGPDFEKAVDNRGRSVGRSVGRG